MGQRRTRLKQKNRFTLTCTPLFKILLFYSLEYHSYHRISLCGIRSINFAILTRKTAAFKDTNVDLVTVEIDKRSALSDNS